MYVWLHSFIRIIIITFFTEITMKYLRENKFVNSYVLFYKCKKAPCCKYLNYSPLCFWNY